MCGSLLENGRFVVRLTGRGVEMGKPIYRKFWGEFRNEFRCNFSEDEAVPQNVTGLPVVLILGRDADEAVPQNVTGLPVVLFLGRVGPFFLC